MRRIFHSLAPAIAAALLLVLIPCPGAAKDPGNTAAGRLPGGVELDRLSPRERERIIEAVGKLVRIHGAIGDPAGGEVEEYVKAVETLARFLKRETIEERRRLYDEARAALEMVDRKWLDRAFLTTSQGGFPVNDRSLAKLEEQTAALHHVGGLLKEEQAIVARQKSIASGAERRFRDLLRLHQEGRRTYESIDNPEVEAALLWIVHELDQVLEGTVQPAHDRQTRLVSLYKKVAGAEGQTQAARHLLKIFREYSSKARVIRKRLDKTVANSD